MKVEIVSKDWGWDELRKQMEDCAGDSFAKAGIVGAKGGQKHRSEKENDERRDSRGRYLPGSGAKSASEGEMNNAELAMIQEFGLGVPERSFLRAAFDRNREKYLSNLTVLVRGIYDRKITVRRALTLLGEQCASDIRKIIIDGAGVPPPNAPATIARKKSSRPLVDTAQMKNAISHEVVLNGSAPAGP